MLLVIDVGNTHTILGIYDGDRLRAHWRILTKHLGTADECGMLINQLCTSAGVEPQQIEGMALASVVPTLTPALEEMSLKYFHQSPLVVNSDNAPSIRILCKDPHAVGADRIANAVAAYELYGGPTIAVDLGTATTFDVVSERGEYLGGVIAPGIETSAAWLFQRAAKLPNVELRVPASILGGNTENSPRVGIIFGAVGQIDEIVHRIEEEIGGKARVIATGGQAYLVAGESRTIQEVNPFLTLEGLRLIYEKHTQGEGIPASARSQHRS